MKKINLSLDLTLRKDQLKTLKRRRLLLLTLLICAILEIVGFTLVGIGAWRAIFPLIIVGIIILGIVAIPLIFIGLVYMWIIS